MKDYVNLYSKIIRLRSSAWIILNAFTYALLEVLTLGVTALFVKLVSTNNNMAETINFIASDLLVLELIKYIKLQDFFIFFILLVAIKYVTSLFYFNNMYNAIFSAGLKLNKLTASAVFGQKYENLKNEKFQSTKNVFHKEIDYCITYFIQPFILLLADIFQIIFLCSFLILFLPMSASFCMLALISMIYLVNRFSKAKVLRISESLTTHQRRRTQVLGNFYSNIIFWKIKQLDKSLYSYFNKENEFVSKACSRLNFYQQVPKLTFEFFIYFILGAFSLLKSNESQDNFFSYVVIALAVVKLLPATVKLSSFLQSALSAKMVIINLNKLMIPDNKIIDNDQIDLIEFKHKLELERGFFSYGGKLILENCNLIFCKNDIISISGSSGSGKSTLIEVLLRQLTLSSGKLIFDGKDITNKKINLSKIVGFVPQSIEFNNDSLRANLLLGIVGEVSDSHIHDILEKCSLTELVSSLPYGIDTVIDNSSNNFSGGERQRIAIARCLLDKNVRILILDEITSALDEINIKKLLDRIVFNNYSLSIIFITHNTIIHKYCNKNYVFNNKKLQLL